MSTKNKKKENLAAGAGAMAGGVAGVAAGMAIGNEANAQGTDFSRSNEFDDIIGTSADNSSENASTEEAIHAEAETGFQEVSAEVEPSEVVDVEAAPEQPEAEDVVTSEGPSTIQEPTPPAAEPQEGPTAENTAENAPEDAATESPENTDVAQETVAEPEVEVLNYQTITDSEGQSYDVAEVSVDGNNVLFVDSNLDGYADIIAADLNGDGDIDDEGEVALTSQIGGDPIAMAPLEDAFMMAQMSPEGPDYVNNADIAEYTNPDDSPLPMA